MATALYTANAFILLSLPNNAKPFNSNVGDINIWLRNNLIDGKAFISNLDVPEFKIGSLDTLIVQSEELAKIDIQMNGFIMKVVEIIDSLKESHTNAYQTISIDKVPIPEYLENFQWETRKFKLDKSIKELINDISTESFQLDSDVRTVYSTYNVAKTNLAASERKKTGNLSVRSLHDIVKPNDFVLDSEYLTTVLIAVPINMKQNFELCYESLSKNVVPGSAGIIKQDKEYILYNVHLFKKSVSEFLLACREKNFIPRDFSYSEELITQLKEECDSAASLERSLRIQLLRLSKTAYSDLFINWFHIKTLRIFVESVLRYGLPPHFITKVIAIPPNNISHCKKQLIEQFGYLGGNAFSKDENGKIKHKDTSLNEYASLVDTNYEPFVIYTVEL